MIKIGINGFGRIGKCVMLQLLNNPFVQVVAINAPDFNIRSIESYLKRDSVHLYSRDFSVSVINNTQFNLYFQL